MLKQQGSGNYIPTKSVQIKPEAQVDYDPKGQNQVRFLFPQYLGFFDPKESKLNFNIKFSGRGRPQPSTRSGVHSLWRDFRIQDGSSKANLEEVQDYNVLTSQWWGYTQNDSIAHKRTMFEGQSQDPGVGDSVYYASGGDWSSSAVSSDPVAKTLQISMPLYSGIMSGSKVFPLVATQGLRLQMTLDNISRSCVFQTGSLGVNVDSSAADQAVELKVAILGATGADAAAKMEKTAVGDVFTCTIRQPSDSSSGLGVNRNATPFNNNPFSIGDRLMVGTGADVKSLGVITKFDKDGDNDLEISFCPDRANGDALGKDFAVGSAVYVLQNDRLNGVSVSNVPQAQIDAAAVAVNCVLSNMEYVLGVVSPPTSYVESMINQMQSSKGLALDYKTYSTYRVNLNAINGLTNQLIPATAMRAYSVLSVPLAQSEQLNLRDDSFQGQTDGCQNYQYSLGSSLIPDRPISLTRYNNLHPHTEALHLLELEKAFTNCGFGVRDLQRVPKKFLIGRAMSRYGQVSDLNSRDLSLRVEYVGATKQKMFNHYVCHLRRMVVSNGNVSAM